MAIGSAELESLDEEQIGSFFPASDAAISNKFSLQLLNFFALFREFGCQIEQCVFKVGDLSVEFSVIQPGGDGDKSGDAVRFVPSAHGEPPRE